MLAHCAHSCSRQLQGPCKERVEARWFSGVYRSESDEPCFFTGGWAKVWGGHTGHPCRQRPSQPHLLQLLQLAFSIAPLQLQGGQLASQSLHLLTQGAALPARFRQCLSGSVQPFLGDRG